MDYITKENFDEAWDYTNKALGKAKKRRVIGGLIGSIGLIIFVLCLLVAILVTIYRFGPDFYAEFLDMMPNIVPMVAPLWKVMEFVDVSAEAMDAEYVKFLLVLVYVPAIAFAAAVTILIHIIYHPFKAKKVEGDEKKKVQIVIDRLEKARKLSVAAQKNFSGLACALELPFLVILLICYVFFGNSDTIGLGALENGLMAVSALKLFAAIACMFVLVNAMNWSYLLVTKVFYWCKVPYEKVVQAERYKVFLEEGVAEHLDEFCEKNLSDAREYEVKEDYAKAKEAFMNAACTGKVAAMDKLAYFLSRTDKEASVYWYQKCLDSGEALEGTKERMKKIKKENVWMLTKCYCSLVPRKQ